VQKFSSEPARRPPAARDHPRPRLGRPDPAGRLARPSDKRIYVWFDAVIGYLSASIEWAPAQRRPDAWREWWQNPDALGVLLHGQGQHRLPLPDLAGDAARLRRQGDKGGTPGPLGALKLPDEVVSSEFLTMEGKKFSSAATW
jgi:methionyl-tRNA synthetase